MNILTVLYTNVNGTPTYSSQAGYSPEWVDKLVAAIERNSSQRNEFYCLVDRHDYSFRERIIPVMIEGKIDGWSPMMETLRPEICAGPRMVLGLDTIVKGNIDAILEWNGDCGLLDDPFEKGMICNGIGMYSQSCVGRLWHLWENRNRLFGRNELMYNGAISEMAFLRKTVGEECTKLNRLFPNQIQSYKAHWSKNDIHRRINARIVYFHGNPKPPNIEEKELLLEHWI